MKLDPNNSAYIDPFARGANEVPRKPIRPFEPDANDVPQVSSTGPSPEAVAAKRQEVMLGVGVLLVLAVIAFLVLRAIVRALRKVPDNALERTAHAAGRVAQRVDDVSGRAKSAFRQGRGTE